MRKVKLSHLCKVSNGFAFKSDDYVSHGYRVMRITNVQKGLVLDSAPKFVSDEIAHKASNFKLKVDDILISLTGNVGRVGKVQAEHLPAILNQRVGLIRPISSEIDLQYLFQFLNSDTFEREAIQNSNGVAQLNLSSKWIENYEIPLPSLDDQIRIAHLLGKVQALITQRKQHLQQLDDLLKSVFLEMFGDPVCNEKGWELTTIGQIIKVASGNGLVAKNMNSVGPYKVYGGNGVNGAHTEYMFDAPTLVIGRVGYYCGSVHITESKSWVTDNALYVKEFLKKTDLVFFKHLLGIHDLNKVAGRAAQPLVSGSRIYPIRTIDVPFENQKMFSAVVVKVESIKSCYQHSLNDLESLYGALSQRAFKGELDLSSVRWQ